ncbi:MAG: hypothetical protein KKH94_05915 [Candidatus Omnitrophica bacterium]|nr:hypothetical protein [Candidatus Omnitrophota bacterium]
MTFNGFIKEYTQKGLIKQQKQDFNAIDAMMSRAIKEIDIAKATLSIDEGTAFTVAYNAMLHVGRALIFSKGYRPIDGAQHKTVVEFATMYLGEKYKTLVLHFEKMRKKRNIFTYEVTIAISSSEVTSAIKSATQLTQAIQKIITKENPQHHFSF